MKRSLAVYQKLNKYQLVKNIDLNKHSQTKLPIEQNLNSGRSLKGIILVALIIISVSGFFGLKYKHEITALFEEKHKAIEGQPKVEYVNGVIVGKTLDIDKNPRILKYRNDNFDTYTITDPTLWAKAELGDSVRVGFTERGETQEDYSLIFKSVDVIGKIKMDTIYGGVIAKTLDVRTDVRALVIKNSAGKVFVIRDPGLWDKAARWDSVKLLLPLGTDLKKSGPIEFATIDVIGKAKKENDIDIFSSEDQNSNTANTGTAAPRRKTTSSWNLSRRLFKH